MNRTAGSAFAGMAVGEVVVGLAHAATMGNSTANWGDYTHNPTDDPLAIARKTELDAEFHWNYRTVAGYYQCR